MNEITPEELRSAVTAGVDVLDSVGNRVGYVTEADPVRGWMKVNTDSFDLDRLFIPYRLVTRVDPYALTMSVGENELRTYYGDPPARTTSVCLTGAKSTATTTQPSGYDDSTVTVTSVDLDAMKALIVPGYKVWTYDQVEVGSLKRYDDATGYMLIEKGSFSKHEMVVPLSMVSGVYDDSRAIQLVSSAADLRRLRLADPAA